MRCDGKADIWKGSVGGEMWSLLVPSTTPSVLARVPAPILVPISHTCAPHTSVSRPRAGRIEEETRLGRSVELVAQRRRAESHLRAQSKAVHAQAEQFAEWDKGLRDQVNK